MGTCFNAWPKDRRDIVIVCVHLSVRPSVRMIYIVPALCLGIVNYTVVMTSLKSEKGHSCHTIQYGGHEHHSIFRMA